MAVLLLPIAKIGWDAATGGLGANPIEAVQNRLGFWTITLLALALVPTPANDLLGVAWPAAMATWPRGMVSVWMMVPVAGSHSQ